MHFIKHRQRHAKMYKDTVVFKNNGHTIRVKVCDDPMNILCKMDTAYKDMRQAEAQIKKNPADTVAQEKYGLAVLDFIAALFGRDSTLSIVEFYEGMPGLMMRDVKRYVFVTALPKIKKMASKQQRHI